MCVRVIACGLAEASFLVFFHGCVVLVAQKREYGITINSGIVESLYYVGGRPPVVPVYVTKIRWYDVVLDKVIGARE